MLSQAIESVTRVFYARADLDLIMSSPVRLANVFSVRIAAIALSVTGMALLLSTPFVDVLVIGGGARWLAAFGVVIAIGLSAAAVAIAITVVLFRLIGPSRTRLVAQIVAADHRRRLRHRAAGRRDPVLRHAVALRGADLGCRRRLCARCSTASLWWPARAAIGDGEALSLAARRRPGAARRRDGDVLAALCRYRRRASPQPPARPVTGRARRAFRGGSRQQALRTQGIPAAAARPWLLSQSLMQLLYLVPPALMLWRSFSDSSCRDRAGHARDRDGGRPARRRPRLADDLGRGRRRPGRDRAAAALATSSAPRSKWC